MYYCNSHSHFFISFCYKFLCGKILQVHRFEEQQPAMQHWLLLFRILFGGRGQSRAGPLVKIEDASPERGLQKRLWAVLLTSLLAILLLNCNT